MTHRVLIATSWVPSAITDEFRALARSLHDAGTEVHWLDDRRRTDVTVDPWVAELHRWPGTGRPQDLEAVRFADGLLRGLRPHTVLANFAAVTPLGLALRRTRVERSVCWYRTLSEQLDMDEPDNRQSNRTIRRRLRRVTYGAYTDVVAVSAAAAANYRAMFGTRGPAIHFRHNAVCDGARRMEPAAPDASIVAVGRLEPSKGHDVLIRAVGQLAPRQLKIIGEGFQRDRLSSLARDLDVALELTGTIEHAEVRTHMARSALVAVPSRAEAFGRVAAEGLAAGVPVVASATGGLEEIIRHGETGRLVPPDDPDALTAAITVALEPNCNATMGDAARRDFLARFDVETCSADLAGRLVEGRPLGR